jgi:cyclase
VRMIDLSSSIDARYWEPDPVTHSVLSPADGAKHMCAEMSTHFGIDFDPAALPDAEFLANDTLTLTSNTGTHVDAPAHYGSRADYRAGPPATIDEVPLDWFWRPGFVLDLTAAPPGAVSADVLRAALEETGYQPAPYDIALLYTGADQHIGTPAYFTEFTGLDGPATEFLLDLGIRVIGTDAFSLDAPFGDIISRYAGQRDPAVLWPAHLTGRQREFCQIERLAHLGDLPAAHGFTVAAFPVKIAGACAGWTRAVAMVAD